MSCQGVLDRLEESVLEGADEIRDLNLARTPNRRSLVVLVPLPSSPMEAVARFICGEEGEIPNLYVDLPGFPDMFPSSEAALIALKKLMKGISVLRPVVVRSSQTGMILLEVMPEVVAAAVPSEIRDSEDKIADMMRVLFYMLVYITKWINDAYSAALQGREIPDLDMSQFMTHEALGGGEE